MGMLGHQARAPPTGGAEEAQVPEVDKMAEDVAALEVELNVAELGAEETGKLMARIFNFFSSDQGLGLRSHLLSKDSNQVNSICISYFIYFPSCSL